MKTLPSRCRQSCSVLALCLALTAASSRSATAPTPASPRATGAAATGEITGHDPIVLSPFEITTTQDEGYRSNNSASGSKTNTAIRETPQSIQIVNQSFMDDIQARSVADALLYTSGITEGQTPRGH